MDSEKEEIIIGEMGVGEVLYYVDEALMIQVLKTIDRRIVNLPENPLFPEYDCKVQVNRARTGTGEEIQFFLYGDRHRVVYGPDINLADDDVANPMQAEQNGVKPLYIIDGMFSSVSGAQSKIDRLLKEKNGSALKSRINRALG